MKYHLQAKDILADKIKKAYICAFFFDARKSKELKFIITPMEVTFTHHPTAISDDNIYIIKHELIKAFGKDGHQVKLSTNSLSCICSFYRHLVDCEYAFKCMKDKVIAQIDTEIRMLTSMKELIANYGKQKPVFLSSKPYSVFANVSIRDIYPSFDKYAGDRKNKSHTDSVYVHGKLEEELGFDLVAFVSGVIEDLDVQDAAIIDIDDVRHECKLVRKDNMLYLVYEEDEV